MTVFNVNYCFKPKKQRLLLFSYLALRSVRPCNPFKEGAFRALFQAAHKVLNWSKQSGSPNIQGSKELWFAVMYHQLATSEWSRLLYMMAQPLPPMEGYSSCFSRFPKYTQMWLYTTSAQNTPPHQLLPNLSSFFIYYLLYYIVPQAQWFSHPHPHCLPLLQQ